jgi:hypothetical protein
VKQYPILDTLARPALHVLLTLGFAAAFFWPILAFTEPSRTFHFSYLAWLGSLGALILVSRRDSAASHATGPDTSGETEVA